MGHFEKHLTVKFAGIDEMKTITLKGDVLVAADYDKWKTDNDAKLKAEADAKPATATATTTKKTAKKTTKKSKKKKKVVTTTATQ